MSRQAAKGTEPRKPVSVIGMPKIVYEFSNFIDYLFLQGPTGIARVDMAYADFLVKNKEHFAAGKHLRFHLPTRFSHRTLTRLHQLVVSARQRQFLRPMGG